MILLGIHSSDLNGLEECHSLKKDSRTSTIPVLFVCDQQDADAKIKGFAAGCVDCLSKPYLAEEVLQRVRTHVALYRMQHRLSNPVATPEKQPQATDRQRPDISAKLNAASVGLPDNETEISNRLRFEQMISDLSARFIHLPSERLDDEIELALKMVLEFFQVDRCGLLHVLPDKNAWKITHVAYSEHGAPVPKGTELPRSIHPWEYEKLAVKGEVVSFARVDDMPDEAHVDKQTCIDWGIRSGLTMPILTGESAVHVICINAMKGERVWPEEFIPRLQLLGEIFRQRPGATQGRAGPPRQRGTSEPGRFFGRGRALGDQC